MSKPILVLGASGIVGRALSQVLLKSTAVPLRLASRSLKTSEGLCASLSGGKTWSRVLPAKCDVTDRAAMEKAMEGVSTVVVCSATRSRIGGIAEAALSSGCELIDIHWSPTLWPEARRYHKRFEEKGLSWITEGGCHPGLPGALVRWAGEHLDSMERVRVSAAFSFKNAIGPGSCVEFAREIFQMRMGVLEEGEWNEMSMTRPKATKVDFGGERGVRKCYPFHLHEFVQAVKELGGVRHASFCIAEGPWLLDQVAMPIAGLMTRKNERLARPAGGLLRRVANLTSSKADASQFLLEANGRRGGKEASLRLSIAHRDPAWLTSLCVSSCLHQMTHGGLEKGVHMMALAVEPRLFVSEIAAHGGVFEITSAGIEPQPAVRIPKL